MAPGSLHGRFLLPKPPKGVRGGGHPPSLIAISAEMGSSEGREGRRGLLASARLQPHAQPCDRPEPWCFRTRPLASSSHPTVRETEPHRWGRQGQADSMAHDRPVLFAGITGSEMARPCSPPGSPGLPCFPTSRPLLLLVLQAQGLCPHPQEALLDPPFFLGHIPSSY